MKKCLLTLCLSLPLFASWSLSGEALLLRPSIGRPYSAILAPSSTSSDRPVDGSWVGNNKPGYAWGYQISLGYRSCAADVEVRWNSWIHTNSSALCADASQRIWFTLTHPVLVNFLTPGLLRRRDQFRVQAIDGEFGHSSFIPGQSLTLRPHAGVRYTRIRYDININVFDSSTSALALHSRWESNVQGIGPRGGMNVSFGIPCHFRFFGDLSAALLLGTAKGLYFDSQSIIAPISVADRMSPINLIIPNGEVCLGLAWNYCWIDLEVSYQLNYFAQGAQRAQFFASLFFGAAISDVTLDSFAMDGWNFSMGITY